MKRRSDDDASTSTAAAAVAPLGPSTPLLAAGTVPSTPLSSSRRFRQPQGSTSATAIPVVSPTTTDADTVTAAPAVAAAQAPAAQGGKGKQPRRFLSLAFRRPRARTEDIGGLGAELPPSPPRQHGQGQEKSPAAAVAEAATVAALGLGSVDGGSSPVMALPPSPLRSVSSSTGLGESSQGQGAAAATAPIEGWRSARAGRSPTLSLPSSSVGVAATTTGNDASAGDAQTTPRTLGSILPTNRAKEVAAAATAVTSPSPSAGPSSSSLVPLPARPHSPSSESAAIVQELRRRLEEAEARAASSEEAVRRLAMEVWALRRQVALLSGAEREGDGENGHTYYDMVRLEGAEALVKEVVGGREAGGEEEEGEGEAALMPLPRINPALLIKESDVVVGPRVGVGAFGEVWKGLYQGRPVAIKCFRAHPPTGAGAAKKTSGGGALLALSAEMVAGEIEMMERVGGRPHVLPLEGVFVSRATREVALVLPLMANGSLHDLLLDPEAPSYRPSVSMNALVRFALQAADGVRGLHQEGVIHRDLACRNLLVDASMNVYVSDFGFARLRPPTTHALHPDGGQEQQEEEEGGGLVDGVGNATLGPVRWEAPESLKRNHFSERTDAFSFGVCLYEMVSRSLPWKGLTHALVAHRVLTGRRLPVPLNADPALAEIMRRCWQQDPRRRPNFEFIYRRLKARHTQLQNEEREVSWERGTVAELRRGTTFHKLPYLKGSPHERLFKVSEDLRRFKWRFLPVRTSFFQRAREFDPVRPPTKQVFLTEVQDVRLGMRTANFSRSEGLPARYQGMAALSVVTRDRTIDLLCPDPATVDRWARGLAFLVLRLRPPPSPLLLLPADDPWAVLAHLRRGSFLLKFGQIGTPHERFFRVSADARQLLWRRGEEGGGGDNHRDEQRSLYRTVDLSAVSAVRLFAPSRGRGSFRAASIGSSGSGQLQLQRVGSSSSSKPVLGPLARGVDDYQYGFSLLNAQGQAELNLVAPNAKEHALWAEGLTRIVQHFQKQQQQEEGREEGEEGEVWVESEGEELPLPLYSSRGEYLALGALAFSSSPVVAVEAAAVGGMEEQPPPPQQQQRYEEGDGNGAAVAAEEREEEEEEQLEEDAALYLAPPKLASIVSSSLVTSDDEAEAPGAEEEDDTDESGGSAAEDVTVVGGAAAAAAAAAAEALAPPPTPPAVPPQEQEEQLQPPPLSPPPPQPQPPLPQPLSRPPAPAVLLPPPPSSKAQHTANVDPEGNYATSFLTFLQEEEPSGQQGNE